MSDGDDIFHETADRLFAERFPPEELRRAELGAWLQEAWDAVEELGLPLALVPEEKGGFGLDTTVALGLVRLTGRYAIPLPIAETMLARRLFADAGLEAPDGPCSVGPVVAGEGPTLTEEGSGWRISGVVQRVPWGRHARAVALVVRDDAGSRVVRIDPQAARIEEGSNIAGHPRDTLHLDTVLAADAVSAPAATIDLMLAGAAMRTLQLAGALERAVEMTASYVGERVQFGRTLSKFQAIQQEMARFAGQAVAARGAADLAAAAFGRQDAAFAIAAAKARASESVGLSVSIAQQLHGAIGFTAEYPLHFLTKALWSWRDEFGGQTAWARIVGDHALAASPDGLWPLVTAA